MDRRPEIAIVIPGGIGTGADNIGVPILERVVMWMCRDFNITVFQLHKVNKDYVPAGFELIEIRSKNSLVKAVQFCVIFLKMFRLKKFDAVHGFWAYPSGFLAVVMGRILNIKSVISLQGGDAISLPEIKYGQLRRWSTRTLALWSLREVSVLVSPTKFLADILRNVGFVRNDIRYIPLGVDADLFRFRERRFTFPIQFLHIGSYNPVKDQVTLLRAFQLIARQIACHLTIIGEGELEGKIRSLAADLNLTEKVTFLGPLPYKSLPAQYDAADILLHTSVAEGHPIVVEEAMSSGVIVCGTRVGLLYDLPECCVSVPVADHVSLATQTLELIANPEKVARIRQKAYQWASDHSIRWTADALTKIYKEQ